MAEQTGTIVSVTAADLAKRNGEPGWLRDARNAAWNAFQSLPAPRLEKTDLRDRSWDLGPYPSTPGPASDEVAELVAKLAGQPLVYVRDGFTVALHLPETWVEQGVVLLDLTTAAREHSAVVQAHLGTVVKEDESKWAALNTALWNGGLFLYVPRGVEMDQPVHFVYEETGQAAGGAPRALVVADENSRVSYVEVHFTGQAADKVHAGVTEVIAKAGAKVTASVVTQYRKGPNHLSVRRASVGNDATVDWVFSDIGDGFSVVLLESDLVGQGSQSTIQGIGIGTGRQHLDLTASVLHHGRYSTSDIRLHGVIKQRANAVYRSSTHIFKNAVGAGSEQHDRMLMLDKRARADAIPMLLIDENDVQRCGHAASVGRMDENQIYYLMSRGIPRVEATKMILWGYLEPTVQRVSSDVIREYLAARIDRELEA
ncbi:Fe-S cluster assembly protein SufD [Alicyclobacillus sp.]|uniref:Fe-S cluster assembly protein SufD n=1 Tax=Alicyclobacillus sp. TaxID=61169 RepID=UPI0025C19CE5|nr:Fe-S cluster assembly protein SufD [Alicyclobacillus sp.]MCL6515708.1 Fe-S cluster assembly protein SufD [Alicyclobacillus sp.]